jgi:hypothetical protein
MSRTKTLNTESNFYQPNQQVFRAYRAGDDFYEALIETHLGLTDEQSQQVNAKLILLLANQVGDLDVLREALDAARQGV